MSTAFRELLRAIAQDVASDRRAGEYADLRTTIPALAGYPTTRDLLDTFALEDLETYPERELLTRVLIEASQRGESQLWSSLLVLAYLPMLVRLRKRIIGQAVSPTDVDQLVLISFLGVVRTFPLYRWKDRSALRLRQQTERQVFRHLKREWLHVRDVEPIEFMETPLAVGAPEFADDEEQEEPVLDLAQVAVVLAALEPCSGDVIVRETTLKGVLLRDYCVQCSDDPDEQERLYQRWKRQRSRLMRRILDELQKAPPLQRSA
jgi:hypothetical protein